MAESGNSNILRAFSLEDYPEYISWWQPEKPPELSSLPNIGYTDGKAAGFLANTDTDFAIFTFWYANPNNTARESYFGLVKVLDACKESARRLNKNYIFCYANQSGMIKLLESQNFTNYEGHLVYEV